MPPSRTAARALPRSPAPRLALLQLRGAPGQVGVSLAAIWLLLVVVLVLVVELVGAWLASSLALLGTMHALPDLANGRGEANAVAINDDVIAFAERDASLLPGQTALRHRRRHG